MMQQNDTATNQETMKSIDPESVSWTLRELAVNARVTVTALLKEAGVSTGTVHRWRHGGQPRGGTIERINKAAQVLRERAGR